MKERDRMSAGEDGHRARNGECANEAPDLREKASDGGADCARASDVDEKERADAGADKLLDEVDELRRLLEESRAEAESFKNAAQREKADFINYRTRVERDRARDRVLAAEGAVDALLPVLDNLDRTLQAVPDKESPLYKGVSMVQRQFFGALQSFGLQVIDTSGAFDPSQHEALVVTEVKDESDDGRILEELHRGYKLGEKVLRAAQVKVGRIS
jgi:molecular chaperone GrpE